MSASPVSNIPIHYTSGRPPWFDLFQDKVDGNQVTLTASNAFLIGVAGGSASGKTSVSEMIIKNLDVPWVVLLSMDSFYKALNVEEKERAQRNEYNFDDPNAFDYDLLYDTLCNLKSGKSVNVPVYDFKTHSRYLSAFASILKRRLPITRHVYGANVVIFEGIYGLYDQRIVDMMDLKIFVDTDDDVRLARRLKRDISERGRDMHGVLQQYSKFVKPSFDQWIRPTMRNADVIIPRGADNVVAIEVMSKHIARQLFERGFSIRSKLARLNSLASSKECPEQVEVMEQTPQLIFIHTMLRDKETCRDDVVFYTERLSRLVVEAGLSTLPFVSREIITPTNDIYKGLTRTDKICGVSIVRAGLVMEKPLRKVCPYVSIGKLLIQTSPSTHEPHLHFCHLPNNVADMHVLLLDATISTGAAMVMALRVLVEHGVQEKNITVLCLIASPLGLNVVCGAFPEVKVVVSAIDKEVELETYRMIPGCGNLGDRYFGTLTE